MESIAVAVQVRRQRLELRASLCVYAEARSHTAGGLVRVYVDVVGAVLGAVQRLRQSVIAAAVCMAQNVLARVVPGCLYEALGLQQQPQLPKVDVAAVDNPTGQRMLLVSVLDESAAVFADREVVWRE